MTLLNRVAGVPVLNVSPDEAADLVAAWADQRRGRDVHLVNAWTVALADGDAEYAALLDRASANLADGHSIVRVTRRSAVPLEQVRGPGFFRDLLERRDPALKHFLLGGSAETLTALHAAIRDRFPAAQVVGSESPPFRALTSAELAAQDARILASGATVVWVGLGTPKQDFEAQRIADSIPVVAVAIGAAFDFIAGTKREAPVWVRRIRLEWLYRLMSEPRRLWRRYLLGNLVFLRAVRRSRGVQVPVRVPDLTDSGVRWPRH